MQTKIYLGTWFQRTSLHLQEIYNFLKFQKSIVGLDKSQGLKLLQKVSIRDLNYRRDTIFHYLEFWSNNVKVVITEDGIIRLTSNLEKSLNIEIKKITEFYSNYLGPVLSYLFSLGAPLPKDLKRAEDVFPVLISGHNIDNNTINSYFSLEQDTIQSTVNNRNIDLYLGEKLELINFKKSNLGKTKIADEIVQYLIFTREFEIQLHKYLNLHRLMWEKVSEIRERREIRFRDFPRVREEILDFLKTLSFVKARLAQMHDILRERSAATDLKVKQELNSLGIEHFNFLDASRDYISDLWQMTIEYVEGTLELLESLYAENTQRELNTLKYITLVGVLTGFFGMNIAFPWEERWPGTFLSSLAVVVLIAAVAIVFYFFLRFFIHNRRFSIKKNK